MIRPTKSFAFLYIGAGLLLVSLMLLTASPLSLTKLILGIVPLIILVFFGVTILRAKKNERTAEAAPEERKED